jgi:peptide/nickel transport system ATP-binding protein
MADEMLLRIEKLVLHFSTTQGAVQAVDEVDFELDYNKAVVILGESGCGKSSLAKAILRLLPRNVKTYSGKVNLGGKDVMALGEEEFRQNVRWVAMSLVPQAAMNALNPVLKVGDQVAEPAMVHLGMKKNEALQLALKMFQHVGVPSDFVTRYPFELSGGMRQRVAIAMALVTSPSLIVLDEPTSALDLLTQANIFNVLKRIKKELGTSFILITHDIATSSELADYVAVMYAGQIVETGEAGKFFPAPLHPYSQKLMASVPRLRANQDPDFITGQPPSLVNLPSGCRFATRCPVRFEKCDQDPPLVEKDGRKARCWKYA